jgi:restriction system protein
MDVAVAERAASRSKGKPLELLDGGNLLHLVAQHAGIEARTAMPEGWVDRPVHGE